MEEDQIYEEIIEEVSLPESSQQPQQANPTGTKRPATDAGQQPQSQQSQQPQAAGVETNDNMVEEALKNGQPSNTISEWQRVHDKKYVEDITEKTEKH